MNCEYNPSSAAARCMFAVVAVVATMVLVGFIDYLATDYAAYEDSFAKVKQAVVASARR
jgi:hypothetical protein